MARVKKADQVVLSFDKASQTHDKLIEGNKGRETVTVRTCATMAEVLAVFGGNAAEVLKAINAYLIAKQTAPTRAKLNVNENKVYESMAKKLMADMARLGKSISVEQAVERVKAMLA